MKTYDETLKSVSEVIRALCIRIDSPRALTVKLLVENKEFEQLASLKVDPASYSDPTTFALDYGISTFLKKCRDLKSTVNRREAAVAAFARSEEACKESNQVIDAFLQGHFCFVPGVSEVVHLAQRKIKRLLGSTLDLFDGSYEWGPGATYSLKRSEAYPDTKLTKLPFEVTGSAWKHAAKLINLDLHWKRAICDANSSYSGPIFKIIPGGRYDTVPKTVLTDRSILVEPRLNTILQKKVGAYFRRLLKRVDVDLNDQSRNQYLAEMAIPLCLSTADLEAASDSVSRGVVELLLPREWVDLLDDLRSKWYQKADGSWHRLEKFSSMGNGFTFELESLIFWAIASSVNELEGYSTLGVYGDDIIVRREVFPRLRTSLSALGFRLNDEKSFVDGDFFESCGAHFFKGINVTPPYQKVLPGNELEAARMGNRLLRWAARLGFDIRLDRRVAGAWEALVRQWTPHPGRFGPITGTDDGYWEAPSSYLANCRPRTRRGSFSSSEIRVTAKVESYKEIPYDDSAMLALWMMNRGTPMEGKMPHILLGLRDKHDSSVGTLPSRVEMRVIQQHRWVKPTALSYLDW